MTAPPADLLTLAEEWSAPLRVCATAYLIVGMAVMALTIRLMIRNSPSGTLNMGRGGGVLMAVASLAWPLWAWWVLPLLARNGPPPPTDSQSADDPAVPATAGEVVRCARCGDRVLPINRPPTWDRHHFCRPCAEDLGIL